MVNDNGHLPLHCAVINKHNVSALDMLYKDNIIEKKQVMTDTSCIGYCENLGSVETFN